jgi:putative ABC transport system permease protein
MFGLRLLWRDWRGGELGILATSIVIAVAIVTGISLFADRLQGSIETESRTFLAADRVLRSSRPVDDSWLQHAENEGLRQAKSFTFKSMVFAAQAEVENTDSMQLASIKAVSELYPLLGELEVSDGNPDTRVKVNRGPSAGEVWVDSRLLPLLDIELGDEVFVGDTTLIVSKVVISEPDSDTGFTNFGPRVLMSTDDLAATNIIQPASRVTYRYLFSGETENLENYGQWLEERKESWHRWQGLDDAQPRISRSIRRAGQFLMLAGALGVALAGVAIALSARRYSERHYDYVAMMKSLGATSRRILSIYLINLLVLVSLSALAGCAVGWVIQQGFIVMLQDFFNVDSFPAATAKPFIIGGVTALVCLMSFALPPLLSLQGVSPLRVLRRDLDKNTISNLLSYTLGIGGIGFLMLWYSGNLELTLSVLVGVGLTFVIVGSASWYLLRGSRLVGMQAGSAWRLALASMHRRGFQNAIQVVIFSLSIMLLLMLALIRGSLIEEWKVQLPEGTPNHFLVNVTESEIQPVEQLLAGEQVDRGPIYPMIRGRLVEVNGVALEEHRENEKVEGRGIDREINLTWADEIPYENKIEQGQWWSKDSSESEISIELELAERLGVELGDELTFMIGSEPLVVSVSSMRTLNWDSMRPNFFMIFPPKVLEQFPATYITSFYLPVDKKILLNQFLRQFPTITVIEMDAIIRQIRSIVDQVSGAVELVLGLIVVSGLLVLVASVQASLDSRFQESAVLRTLGAGRRLVLGSLVIEFAVLGLLAGLMAALSAEVSVFGLQQFVLDMDSSFHPWVWLAGPVIGAILIGSAGYITCRKVVNTPPVDVLREL